MSVQRLHPLEKTSIQVRHTIKRLEMFIETSKDDFDKSKAEELLTYFNLIRKAIPQDYQDVDLIKEKE